MSNQNNNKFEIDIADYWHILRKRSLFVFLIFALITAGVYIYNSKQEPVFSSTTILNVTHRQPVAKVQGTSIQWYGSSSGLEAEISLIANTEKLHKAALAKLQEIAKDKKNDIPAEVVNYIESLSPRDLKSKLDVRAEKNSSQISISYTGAHKRFTELACNAMAAAYSEDFTKNKTSEAKKTVEFIKKQLTLHDNKLKALEDKINKEMSKKDRATDLEELWKKKTELDAELAALSEKYTDLHPDVIKTKAKLDKLTKEIKSIPDPKSSVALEGLLEERKTNIEVKAQIRKQLITAEISYNSLQGKAREEVKIIMPASPAYQIAPNTIMNMIIGSIMALLIGCIAAFVVEGLDTSIGKIEDVEMITGLPVISQIPLIGSKPKKSWFGNSKKQMFSDLEQKLLFNFKSKSIIAEAYRSLRTNIQFSMGKKNNVVIGVTSSSPNEGKTLTATNLAFTLAGMGKMTLLIEADMRSPKIAKLFKIDETPGLSDLLVGTHSKEDAIRSFTDILMGDTAWDKLMNVQGIDLLSVLPCGTMPYHPAELLSSPEFADLLKELRNTYDYIIIDTPPVLPVTDPLIISALVDGLLIIYQSDQTSRHLLLRTIQLLRKHNAPILGTVINQLSFDVTLKDNYRKYY